MEKNKNLQLWTEEGYTLFAQEGLAGIQVERLARILKLNKSGFYHYFGDLEGYCADLLRLHNAKVSRLLDEVRELTELDPGYLCLLVKHATTVMFQVQLTRNKESFSFYEASEKIDLRVDLAVRQLWSDFMGTPHHTDLALRYYMIVRDMFYQRVSFQNLNYSFLHDLVTEARILMQQIGRVRPSVALAVKARP